MIDLKTMLAENASTALVAGGLLIGIVFGAMAQRTGFCTLGALSDLTLFGDARRLRSWLLAIAVALLGTQALYAAEIIRLDASLYRADPMPLGGHLIGGLLFGAGMVLAGGCVSRNVVRAGSGDLRALMTLLALGLVAAIALGGVLGPARVAFTAATAHPQPTLPGPTYGIVLASLLTGALLLVCFRDSGFRGSPTHIVAGLSAGLCVVAGWALTGLAHDEFADTPVRAQSLTFVRPVADTMDWLERFTALGAPEFTVTTLAGTLFGSALSAAATRTFKLSTFADVRDTLRNLTGAVLMGVGGVLALGCSIGQGITGVSTLSPGSFVAALAIAAGAILTLKASERYSILT